MNPSLYGDGAMFRTCTQQLQTDRRRLLIQSFRGVCRSGADRWLAEASEDVDPFAGITQIRFNGYTLRPSASQPLAVSSGHPKT
jgi:hypothetical protein